MDKDLPLGWQVCKVLGLDPSKTKRVILDFRDYTTCNVYVVQLGHRTSEATAEIAKLLDILDEQDPRCFCPEGMEDTTTFANRKHRTYRPIEESSSASESGEK